MPIYLEFCFIDFGLTKKNSKNLLKILVLMGGSNLKWSKIYKKIVLTRFYRIQNIYIFYFCTLCKQFKAEKSSKQPFLLKVGPPSSKPKSFNFFLFFILVWPKSIKQNSNYIGKIQNFPKNLFSEIIDNFWQNQHDFRDEIFRWILIFGVQKSQLFFGGKHSKWVKGFSLQLLYWFLINF